ncbi:MAG: MmgE/PrpD family protein [Armatimonadota bacterium]
MAIRSAPTRATDLVASFVSRATYDDLPADVRAYAKRCLLDSLGCAVAGSRLEAGEIALDLMGKGGAPTEALIAATGVRVSVLNAAYLNSYLASVLDFDDFYIVHPGVTAGPVALAVADFVGASGRDLLLAVVLAYEIQLRVALAIQPSRTRMFLVGGCSTPQVFGPAAATASLLKLSGDQAISAFGLAAANAPVPHKTNRSVGGNPRPLSWVQGNPGWISMGGVLAGQMAQRGFRGRLEILDGDMGFWAMAGSDQCDFERLTDGLGHRFEMLNVAFKPYPCCRYIHSAAEALETILSTQARSSDEIERVVVRSVPLLGAFMDYAPKTFVDGQFSLPYVLGLVLARRRPGYGWLSQDSLADPDVLSAAHTITFEPDDAAAEAFAAREYPATVTVHTARGAVSETVAIPRGDPRRPLLEEEIQAKFLSLAAPVLGPRRAGRLMDLVYGLEDVGNLRTALADVYSA